MIAQGQGRGAGGVRRAAGASKYPKMGAFEIGRDGGRGSRGERCSSRRK